MFSLLLMTEDSATLSLNLSNQFPEAEESQTRHREPTLKKIQTEDRQSNDEMMEILKYMKSEIASLTRKREALACPQNIHPGLKPTQRSDLTLIKESQVSVDTQFQ